MSQHATIRGQQRDVPAEIIGLILRRGQPEKKQGNTMEYRIRKRDLVRLISNCKYEIHLLERTRDKAVLVSGEEDLIITVYASG